MEFALEVKGLRKTYKEFGLKNISMKLPKGCVLGLIGENGLAAGMRPFFQDILMKRDPHTVFEYVGNVILAHIEIGSQTVKTQVFFQMLVDVIADPQVKHVFKNLGSLMKAVIKKAVYSYKKGDRHQLRRLLSEGTVVAKLLQKIQKLALQILGRNLICRKTVAAVLCRVVKTVGKLWIQSAQPLVIISADPENKPAVRLLMGQKVGKMRRTGRDQQTVPIA